MNPISSALAPQNPEEAWGGIVKVHNILSKAIIFKNSQTSKIDQTISKLSTSISKTQHPNTTPTESGRLGKAKLDKIISRLSTNLFNNESILIEQLAKNLDERLLENLSAEVEELSPSEKKIQDQIAKIIVKAQDKCIGTEGEQALRKEISDRMAKDPEYAARLLAQAIEHNAFNLIRVLVELGTDIYSRPPPGLKCGPDSLEGISFINLAIFYSEKNKDFSLLNAFRAGGWNPDKRDFVGETGLDYAAQYDSNGALFKKILNLGADINLKDDKGRTALHIAVSSRLPPRVTQLFMKHGADIEARDGDGLTPLQWAVNYGNTSAVSELLDGGADPNIRDKKGSTPLTSALWFASQSSIAKQNSIDILKILIEKADINYPTESGSSPLHCAIFYNFSDYIPLLVQTGADLKAKFEDYTPLQYAIRNKKEAAVLALIEAGADVNLPNSKGWTPLHDAAKADSPSIVLALIEAGADVNLPNSKGRTPLHNAAKADSPSIVLALIEAGADVNLPNSKGWTPLHNAAKADSPSIVLALIEAGADVNLPNSKGWTPLHYAAKADSPSIIKLLVKKGAKLDVYSKRGNTPLEIAIADRKESAIATLKSLGADTQYAINKMKTQFMSHIWGVGGEAVIQGKKISNLKQVVEGHIREPVPLLFHSYLTDFFNVIGNAEPTLTPAAKQFILKAFKNAYPNKTDNAFDKIVKANQSNEPCLILGGTSDHSISITVSHNLLSISNRGLGKDKQQEATDVFELPKHMQTPELFEKLTEDYANIEEFYNMLHSLGLTRVMGIPHKDQKVGNCVTANTKAALLFLFVLVANGDVKEGRRLYKQFTSYLRERTLTDYEKKRSPDPAHLKKLHGKRAQKAAKKQETSKSGFFDRKKATPAPRRFLGYNSRYLSSDYHIHRDPLVQKSQDYAWKSMTKIDALLEKAATTGLKKAKLDEIMGELQKNISSNRQTFIDDLGKDISHLKIWENIQKNIRQLLPSQEHQVEEILLNGLSKVILPKEGQDILDQIQKIIQEGYQKRGNSGTIG